MARRDAQVALTIRLTPTGAQLWRGTTEVRLRPKTTAVLTALVAQAGCLVTKDALLQTVWPDTAVSEAVLTVCINELRQALGDSARQPQYLETVPRRGYRWLGNLAMRAPMADVPALEVPAHVLVPPHLAFPAVPERPGVVGREAECAHLHAWLAQAQQGERQMGFIAAPAGMGKTTVVDTFVAHLVHRPEVWLARGQCIEHYGAGEAYLPVFEALGQLGRGPDGATLVAGLRQYAPTWLVQMPAFLDPTALEALQRRVVGATPERMLRETEGFDTADLQEAAALLAELG
jgi:DNA-binding winged helix-turn-helix (wHTH) protein